MPRKKSRRSSSRLSFDALEPRQLLSADVYQPGFDPAVGATINAFIAQDPRSPLDSYDITTGWLSAVEELAAVGADQVNFSVYRRVDASGSVVGGTHLDTLRTAVSRANELGLSVSLLPLFETDQGWRGDYNPTGSARIRFQQDYRQFVLDLAAIGGTDRLTVASELNAMHADSSNNAFFDQLIADVANSGFAGQIGVTANFDVYRTTAFERIWSNPEIDFLGVSAYGSLIAPSQHALVAGTGAVSDAVLDTLTEAWNEELDTLESVADRFNLPVFIQEFGSVKKNYTSIFPWSVEPGDVVSSTAGDRYAEDPDEQAATYKSLLRALDGRGDKIIGVDFWSWEHQADRGQRSFDVHGGVINQFSIWPTDNAGGTEFVNFLASEQTPVNAPVDTPQSTSPVPIGFVATDDVFSTAQNSLNVLENDSAAATVTSFNDASQGRVSQNADGSLHWQGAWARQTLSTDSLESLNQFGHSVAIDGNLAVVGSPFYDSNFRINNGAIFVYEFSNDAWQQVATVLSPTDKSGDLFGWSVDIEGDTIVVGSMHDDMFAFNSGAAYVLYQGETSSDWSIAQSLPGSNVRVGDRFGVSVAIDGGLIAVGNRFANGAALNSGTVNLFRANEFRQYYESDIVESPLAAEAQFGWDVDLYEQQLIVGAPRSETGSAFLYQLNEWGQAWRETELTAESVREGDRFGYSVAISESGTFVGGTLHDHAGTINTGAVWQFDLSGDFEQKIIQSSPRRGDQFGFDISADAHQLVASAVGVDSTGINSGRVYQFGNLGSGFVLTDVFDNQASSRFGHAVAIDGDQTMAAAPLNESVVSLNRQAIATAVTFDYTVRESALLFTGEIDDSFGSSIAISGVWAAIGASTGQTRTSISGGEVLIYKQTNDQWNFHSRLAPSTVGDGDLFGSSLALEGDVLVVGSRLADAGAIDAGAAYVFELENDQWHWRDRLFAEGIDAGDQFGHSVSTDGDRIVVGAIYDEQQIGGVTDSGTATVFERSQQAWQVTDTLTSDSPVPGNRFGHDVSVDGNSLAVSSPTADGTGKAFLYQLESYGWQFAAAFTADDTMAGDEFGNSLSLSGSRLAVGAWKHDHLGVWNTGAAYVFEFSNNRWQQTNKLLGKANFGSLLARDQFGSSVDLDGDQLAIGAAYEDASGEDSGAVYLFDAAGGELNARFAGIDAGDFSGSQVAASGAFVLSTSSDGNVAFQNTVASSAQVTLQN